MEKETKIPIYIDFNRTEKKQKNSRDTITTWAFESACSIKQYGGELFYVPKSYIGKLIYIIYVIYSTNDSFSSQEFGGLEILEVTDDSEIARKTFEMLKEGGDDIKETILPSGRDVVRYPWGHWGAYYESTHIAVTILG